MWPWKKLKQGFKRLREKFAHAFKSGDTDELEEILIEADIGVETTMEFIQASRGRPEKLKEIITSVLEPAEKEIAFTAHPTVIMIAGTNGSGKTTTIAKLATLWREKKVLIAACDTYRDAAGLQLERWAKTTNTDLVSSTQRQDAGAVVYDALHKALSGGYGVVLVDTAGRLHTRKDLMAEAEKIHRVIKKVIPNAPHEVILVLDASTGQNGLRQAQGFKEHIDVTGVILTKMDGTSKAGIIIPIVKQLKLPIYFIGLGEKADDIAAFAASNFVSALLGE